MIAAATLALLLPLPAQAIISHNAGLNINQYLGAERFYNAGYTGTRTIQANIEAGHIWNGHQTLGHVTTRVTGSGALGTDDSHATRVGAALSGRRTPESGVVYPNDLRAWGIAYDAETWSGAIATSFSSGTTFNLTNSSLATTYRPIIQSGVGGQTADVFNSSWGFTDPTGTNIRTRGVDGLINANGTVGVFAAGNDGPDPNTVFGMGAGYNAITVAALGADNHAIPYNTVSSFSSRGPNNFANHTSSPTSFTTIPGVRAAVDIAAPGQNLRLANITSSTAYATNQAGTSFSAPLVAGGASLIVDAGKDLYAGNSRATDGRVVKAALLNSADKIAGWNNGQVNVGGVMRTTQSLDWASGAGRMNLDRAFDQYVSTAAGGMAGTTDLAGLGAGDIAPVGWDFGWVDALGSNTYFIDQQLMSGTNFTTTLSWFADRDPGNMNNFNGAKEQHLANLDLSIFLFDDLTTRNVLSTVAESVSLYNVVEHLSFLTPVTGYYGIQVSYTDAHWNFTNETGEFYGLAWSSTPLIVLPGERFWSNPGGGNFGTADNWDPSATPLAADTAVFDLSGSYTVEFSGDHTSHRMVIGYDHVTFALNGHAYALTSVAPSEFSIAVGAEAGDDAQLVLTGGTLSGVSAVLGSDAASAGQVTVAAGATWTNSADILIGHHGTGTLTIEDGGIVSSTFAEIGSAATAAGYVNVIGIGSTWANSGELVVGAAGAGTLTIEQGGFVSSTSASIASSSGSTGEVTVTGAGSEWQIAASLFVGGSSMAAGGSGTLDISDAGAVTVAGTLSIWTAGIVNLSGGELKTATLDLTDGAFNMTGGRLVVDTVIGDLSIAGGTLAFGNSAGFATITGDYTQQAAATLEIELGGTLPGTEFDFLDVGGAATLAGTLAVSLIDDFMPAFGQTFDILAALGGITGTFTTTLLPGLNDGLTWDIFYGANSVMLAIGLAGDLNGDGTVDAADYVFWRKRGGTQEDYDAWRTNFGNTAPAPAFATQSASFAPVPEPASLTLLLFAAASLLFLRCRAHLAPR